jgi:hypothetical protein
MLDPYTIRPTDAFPFPRLLDFLPSTGGGSTGEGCFPILTRLAWQLCRFPAGISFSGLAQRGRPPFPMGKHWPCFNRDGHIRCGFQELF